MISGLLTILLTFAFLSVIAALFTMLIEGNCPVFLVGSVVMLVTSLLLSFGWLVVLLVRTWV